MAEEIQREQFTLKKSRLRGTERTSEEHVMSQATEYNRWAEGQIDVWDFYDLDHGRELPCGNVRTFLYYLMSPGTQAVDLEGSSVASGTATLRLSGPRADDGQPLTVRYRVDRTEVHEVLEEWEQSLLLHAIREHRPSPGSLRPPRRTFNTVCGALDLARVA